MLRVKGIYDGQKIQLLEAVKLPPNTPVQITIWPENADQEALYQQRLIELGLIAEGRPVAEKLPSFTPIRVQGKPVSETILEARRYHHYSDSLRILRELGEHT
jgi:hypothetical protein